MRLGSARPKRALPRVVVLGAVAVAACGSPAERTTNVVTIAQARSVVQKYDRIDMQAAATCSATLNDTVEGGDLAAVDDNDGGFSSAVCGVLGTPKPPSPSATPEPVPASELIVPRGSSYPAVFFQYVEEDLGFGSGEQPYVYVLESTRRGAPWKAYFQVKLLKGSPYPLPFRRDAQGYAPAALPPTAPGYQLTPGSACQAAADQWDAVYSGASTPATFADPAGIAASGTSSKYASDDAQNRSQFGIQTSRAWTCGGTEVAEPMKNGEALVVFTLRGVYTYKPRPNETFFLNETFSEGRSLTLVPQGLYDVATVTELNIVAALVPPTHSSAQPQLIGGYSGVVHVTSSPAQGGVLTPGPG